MRSEGSVGQFDPHQHEGMGHWLVFWSMVGAVAWRVRAWLRGGRG